MSKSSKAESSRKGENVKVVVRCRPLNKAEESNHDQPAVQVDNANGIITVGQSLNENHHVSFTSGDIKRFTFDYTYPPGTEQEHVFNQTAKGLIDSCINGYNGTIFAYGQTGTGKTFTMEGVDTPDKHLLGITPRTFSYIFDTISTFNKQTEFLVRVSFLELYNENVYDLLSANAKQRIKMEVKESKEYGIFVKDLSIYNVKSAAEMSKILAVGQKSRKVGATKMNEGSSRSHSVLSITIESSTTDDVTGATTYKVGKLNLVDLAGSERQKKTEATGERLEEAKAINWSLTVLGNCIKALVDSNTTFVPYRDSKLTRLLQDSLGGNTKTVMIANIGPAFSNIEETISTLRYADRAKQIKNKPVVNEDSKDAMLRSMQDEITALKQALLAKQQGMKLTPEMLKLLANASGVAGSGMKGTSNSVGEHMIDITQLPSDMIEEKITEKIIVQNTGISIEELKRKEAELQSQIETLSEEKKKELESIRQHIEQATRIAAEYEEELNLHTNTLSNEEQQLQKLQVMLLEKEQLLVTGSNKLSAAQEQKKELERIESELAARRAKQEEMMRSLEHADEQEIYIQQHYTNAQDELQQKNQSLKKLWSKYCEKKEEILEIGKEWENGEKEDLIETVKHLDKQLKLLNLCISQYVPDKYMSAIEQHSVYDDVTDQWIIHGIEYTGSHVMHHEAGDVNDTMHYDTIMRNQQLMNTSGISPFAQRHRHDTMAGNIHYQPSHHHRQSTQSRSTSASQRGGGGNALKSRDMNLPSNKSPYFSYSSMIETKPEKPKKGNRSDRL